MTDDDERRGRENCPWGDEGKLRERNGNGNASSSTSFASSAIAGRRRRSRPSPVYEPEPAASAAQLVVVSSTQHNHQPNHPPKHSSRLCCWLLPPCPRPLLPSPLFAVRPSPADCSEPSPLVGWLYFFFPSPPLPKSLSPTLLPSSAPLHSSGSPASNFLLPLLRAKIVVSAGP
jgi:hypothetical protein